MRTVHSPRQGLSAIRNDHNIERRLKLGGIYLKVSEIHAMPFYMPVDVSGAGRYTQCVRQKLTATDTDREVWYYWAMDRPGMSAQSIVTRLFS
jgi:hypothetical protein